MTDPTPTSSATSCMLIVAVAVGGAFYLAGKHLEVSYQSAGTISVSAQAHVSGAPDIAQLSFGIQTGPQPTAKAAIARIANGMQDVLAAVKKLGIEDKDITTESFWLSPSYDYSNGQQRLRGYEANQSLRVKVRDLDKVGDVLTDATAAGANQAGSINFTFDDPDALTAQARAKAIENAKQKAQVLASQLGIRLGKLKSFSDSGYSPQAPIMYNRVEAEVMAMDKSVPIPSGEQNITADVTLTYELN